MGLQLPVLLASLKLFFPWLPRALVCIGTNLYLAGALDRVLCLSLSHPLSCPHHSGYVLPFLGSTWQTFQFTNSGSSQGPSLPAGSFEQLIFLSLSELPYCTVLSLVRESLLLFDGFPAIGGDSGQSFVADTAPGCASEQ